MGARPEELLNGGLWLRTGADRMFDMGEYLFKLKFVSRSRYQLVEKQVQCEQSDFAHKKDCMSEHVARSNQTTGTLSIPPKLLK